MANVFLHPHLWTNLVLNEQAPAIAGLDSPSDITDIDINFGSRAGLCQVYDETCSFTGLYLPMRAWEFDLLGRVLKNAPVRRVVPHAGPANISTLSEAILAEFESKNPTTIPSCVEERFLDV